MSSVRSRERHRRWLVISWALVALAAVGSALVPRDFSGVALALWLAASAAFAIATRARPHEPPVVDPATTPRSRQLNARLDAVGQRYHNAPFPVRFLVAPIVVLVGVGVVFAITRAFLWLPLTLLVALAIVWITSLVLRRPRGGTTTT